MKPPGVEENGEEFILEKLHKPPFHLRQRGSKWSNPAGDPIRSIRENRARPKGCGSPARMKAAKWWHAAVPAARKRKEDELDEEGKAIEAGKEDEHSKEPLPGGFGQDMAQTIAKEE